MKKWLFTTIALCFVFSLAAQTPCRTIPYVPIFGTAGDTSSDARQWSFQQFMNVWQFRTVPSIELNLYYQDPGLPAEYFKAISPCFDLISSDHYRLEMTYQGIGVSSVNSMDVYATYKSGSDWVVDLAQLPKLGSLTNLLPGVHNVRLDFQAPSQDRQWALMFVPTSAVGQGDFVMSQIKLKHKLENDLQLWAFEAPNPSCNINQKTLILSLKNNGTLRTQALEVCYQVNQQAPVCQSFSGPFKTDTTYTLEFSQKINFSQGASTMKAFIRSSVKDEVPSNDTLLNRLFFQTTETTVPYIVDFAERDDFAEWVVINPNTNRTSWVYDNGAVQISTASDATNDILVSPCINLKKGQLYRVRFDVLALAKSKGEMLRVLIGKGSDRHALKQVVLTHKNFTNPSLRQATCFFTVDEDTQYHLAFQAFSEALRSGIRIDNIAVEPFDVKPIPAYRGFETFESMENLYVLSPGDSNWFYYNIQPFAGQTSLKIIPDNKRRVSSWFSSSPLKLEAGVSYKFSYAVKLNEPSSAERLRVFVASSNDPDQIVREVFVSADSTSLTAGWKRVTRDIQVSTSGAYFLCFEYTNTSLLAKGISIDELAVFQSELSNNVRVVRNIGPSSSCSFTDQNRNIALTLKNFSDSRQNDLVFYYQINKGDVVTSQPVSSIAANALLTVDLSNLDLSKDSVFKIRAWIKTPNDNYPGDDSSTLMTVRKLSALKVPIYNNFESELDIESWPFHGVATTWSLVNQSAQSGRGALYTRSGIQVGDASIVTPCIALDPNRTQVLSFYYKGEDATRNESIEVRMGNRQDVLSRTVGSVQFSNTSYQRYVVYFRPEAEGITYLSINHRSPALNKLGGVYVDNLLIADSADFASPDFKVTALNLRKSTPCDLSPDTLVLSFENHGFSEIQNPKVRIQKSSGAVIEETLNVTIQPEQKLSYKLKTTWVKNAWGLDSVRVYFTAVNVRNPSDDTSAWVSSIKIPVQPLPFNENFNNLTTRSRWNEVATTMWEQMTGPKDRYWYLSTTLNTGQAYAITNIEGASWLLGPCVRVDSAGLYAIGYQYAATDATKTETLIAYLVNEQGVKQTLAEHASFTHTNVRSHDTKYRIAQTGIYRLLFYAPGAVGKSGVILDNIYWRGDTVPPLPPVLDTVYDIAMQLVLAPQTATFLNRETLRYTLKNEGNIRATKIPVSIYLAYHKDTIPPTKWPVPVLVGVDTVVSIDSGKQIEQVFTKPINLSEKGSYQFTLIARLPLDKKRSNDTLRKVVIHRIPSPISIGTTLKENPYILSPNPARDYLSIDGPSGMVTIEVFTLSGRRIYHKKQWIPNRLETDQWLPGTYVLRIDGLYSLLMVVV